MIGGRFAGLSLAVSESRGSDVIHKPFCDWITRGINVDYVTTLSVYSSKLFPCLCDVYWSRRLRALRCHVARHMSG